MSSHDEAVYLKHMLYRTRPLATLTRSVSEALKPLPRLRFGLVCDVSLLTAGSIDYAAEAHHLANGRSRADLDSDRLYMLATTRLLEMMGEAATRLSADTRLRNPDFPWKEMIGLRHHLVHGYDKVNLDMIWEILTVDLPPLIAAIEGMINPPPRL